MSLLVQCASKFLCSGENGHIFCFNTKFKDWVDQISAEDGFRTVEYPQSDVEDVKVDDPVLSL